MTKRLVAMVGVIVLAFACSSTGEPGPLVPSSAAPREGTTDATVDPSIAGSSSAVVGVTETTGPVTTASMADAGPVPANCGQSVDGWLDLPGGRRVLVRRPASPDPMPAVVVLHGYLGTAELMEGATDWTGFLGPRNVAVAYPEGTATGWGGFGWNTGSGRFSTADVDDIDVLVAVVQALVTRACVDPARVALTGASNGGAMTLLAACDERTRSRFISFAPVIPAIDDGVVERCGDGPPLRFVALAGRLDGTIPYDGIYPAGLIPLLGQEAWFSKVVARRNQCGTTFDRSPIDDAEVITPTGCVDHPQLVAIADGTHTWPGGPAADGDVPTGRFPGTAFIWERSGLA